MGPKNGKMAGNSKVPWIKHWYPLVRVCHVATTRTAPPLRLKCGHNKNTKSLIWIKIPFIFLRPSSHVRTTLEMGGNWWTEQLPSSSRASLDEDKASWKLPFNASTVTYHQGDRWSPYKDQIKDLWCYLSRLWFTI